MKKAILSGAFSLALLTTGAAYANTAVAVGAAEASMPNQVTLTVEMYLVDNMGNPVTSSGVHGYWALNVLTGELYETDTHTPDLFLGLPPGTYTFGTISNPWCGGNQVDVTLDASMQGDPVPVQLVFWEE
ncbi:hypothetical protein [Taibaiella helva]|uniref:hypothetical protein n=1 Tax=Taibaiella helva TaxID=2301235 RepID=UPI000E58BB44|nr:hypothetical protein [Taibaiella helva]